MILLWLFSCNQCNDTCSSIRRYIASAVGFEPSPRQTGVDLKRAAPCCCRVRSYGKERYRSFGQELKTRNLFRFERVTIV